MNLKPNCVIPFTSRGASAPSDSENVKNLSGLNKTAAKHHLLGENQFEIEFLVLEHNRGWFFKTREGSEKTIILGVLDNCTENRRKLDMRRLEISTNVPRGSISCQQRVPSLAVLKLLLLPTHWS